MKINPIQEIQYKKQIKISFKMKQNKHQNYIPITDILGDEFITSIMKPKKKP